MSEPSTVDRYFIFTSFVLFHPILNNNKNDSSYVLIEVILKLQADSRFSKKYFAIHGMF